MLGRAQQSFFVEELPRNAELMSQLLGIAGDAIKAREHDKAGKACVRRWRGVDGVRGNAGTLPVFRRLVVNFAFASMPHFPSLGSTTSVVVVPHSGFIAQPP